MHLRSPSSRTEGAGKTGCALHPRSRVQLRTKNAHTSIQVQREHPGLPCAVALRLIPRSPWRRIPFASIAGGLKALAKPGWVSQNLRRLDTSNGCQNHTALPSATASFVGARLSLTGHKPALRKPCCAPGALRPPLPAPNVRDDREAPLLWARDGDNCSFDLPDRLSAIFLREGMDRLWLICPSGCFVALTMQLRHCERSEAIDSPL